MTSCCNSSLLLIRQDRYAYLALDPDEFVLDLFTGARIN